MRNSAKSVWGLLGMSLGVALVSGCHDPSATLPAGTQNPAVFNTPAGAIMKRNTALVALNTALEQYIIDAGLLTDELEDRATGASLLLAGSTTGSLDERILPELSALNDVDRGSASYVDLQKVRGRTSDAIGALAKYDSAASPALRGEMYAVQGYADVMLAELFCSGVPLSTFDFEADFTYKPSSTQQAVYQSAIAKFDTAIALSSDSARILNLARVGKGRALLDLGDYTNAAAAVSAVPDGFKYQVSLQWALGPTANDLNQRATVSDNEGTNGIPFIFSNDPRSQSVQGMFNATYNLQLYFPKKYSAGLTSPFYASATVADGIEARLIQAEAALYAGDPSWLTILNALRTDGTVIRTYTRTCRNGISGTGAQAGSPCPAGVVDTTWGPGIGAGLIPASVLADIGPVCPTSPSPGTACTDTVWYRGLRPLSDPGTASGRLDLLFRERAYWLYMTGHRQGDLRRLVRNYQRDPNTVYPAGPYLAPGQGVYGTDVTAPIPSSENPNPYFHGCLDRNA